MKRVTAASLMNALLILTPGAMAWDAGGHRIIADIAWLQLDQETREKAIAIINQHERFQPDFVDRTARVPQGAVFMSC